NAAVRTAKGVFPTVTQRCGLVGIEIGPLSLLNLGASAESYRIGCRVRIAPQTMTTATQTQLCSLMVHEWGHLAGLEHSPDPDNFMNERVPHNRVCGLSDEEARAQQVLEGDRALRRESIKEKVSELRGALRAPHRARRRARGAKRARLARRGKLLERRIKRLGTELRSL
ncbi:MAG TPA: matrixin family metalloprotease, partial [Thermoleophilaceae bacterium]|nr:matrixin family metalloprotease [Thermoleophilaceae bacterium]